MKRSILLLTAVAVLVIAGVVALRGPPRERSAYRRSRKTTGPSPVVPYGPTQFPGSPLQNG